MVNYKLVYLKLKQRYPEIAKELVPDQPPMDEYDMLKAFTIFCKIKGIYCLTIPENRTEVRDLFVATFVKLYDPEYFMHKKKLRKGLRPKMAKLLNCQESIISYNLSNVKNYLTIYRSFNDEVEYIYETIKSALDGKEIKDEEQSREEIGVNP